MSTFNGVCESGIGSLKRREHEITSADGRPAHWNTADSEAARLQANATRHPWRWTRSTFASDSSEEPAPLN